MKKIGWIGYGNMGIPMTNNLMNNGHQVMVYVRNKQKLDDDFDKRFVFTDSIAELIDHSNYIFLMLPNDDVCENIINKMVEIPLYLLVGQDAYTTASGYYQSQFEELEKFKDLSFSTNFTP